MQKIIFILLLITNISYSQIKIGNFTILKLKNKTSDYKIEILYNEKKYSEIRLDELTNGNIFDQYLIHKSFFNKNGNIFYFGNLKSVYQYNIRNRKLKKIFPLNTDPPNTTYRIINLFKNNNSLLLLKGNIVNINNKLVEFNKTDNGSTYTHVLYNINDDTIDQLSYINIDLGNGDIRTKPIRK